MPVIRISDRTWERLKAHARPLEDTPDDVVVLALDALEAARNMAPPIAPTARIESKINRAETQSVNTEKLPQKEFRVPLLVLLAHFGGSASVKEIRAALEPIMKPRLREGDYEKVSSGEIRWWNAVCWERKDLVDEGLLRADSERGVWELSEKGRKLTSTAGKQVLEKSKSVRWKDDVAEALESLDRGNGVPLNHIYEAVRKIRTNEGRSAPKNFNAVVRQTLESNCFDSDAYNGEDLFYMPKGKGQGIWGLKKKRQIP